MKFIFLASEAFYNDLNVSDHSATNFAKHKIYVTANTFGHGYTIYSNIYLIRKATPTNKNYFHLSKTFWDKVNSDSFLHTFFLLNFCLFFFM